MIENQIKKPQTYTHGEISICCEYGSATDRFKFSEIKVYGVEWNDVKQVLEKRKKEIESEFQKIENAEV